MYEAGHLTEDHCRGGVAAAPTVATLVPGLPPSGPGSGRSPGRADEGKQAAGRTGLPMTVD
jgi:hypothetical protein